jgi:hypothetical protein
MPLLSLLDTTHNEMYRPGDTRKMTAALRDPAGRVAERRCRGSAWCYLTAAAASTSAGASATGTSATGTGSAAACAASGSAGAS